MYFLCFKIVVECYELEQVFEYFVWFIYDDSYFNDLLFVLYDWEILDCVCDYIDLV